MRTLTILLLVLASGACASSGAVPRPFPGATPIAGGDPAAPAEAPKAEVPAAEVPHAELPAIPDHAGVPMVISTALEYLGTPYRNGGSDPAGFDCSGFVQFVFARHGRSLPREVRDQYRTGADVDLRDVQPGDLLFFQTVGPGATHVGMALGNGRFVHAPSARGVVRVESYTAVYWARRFVGARRVSVGVSASADPARAGAAGSSE